MGTTSLIDRQEPKEKTDRLYTPAEIIELFQSTGIEKNWSFNNNVARLKNILTYLKRRQHVKLRI